MAELREVIIGNIRLTISAGPKPDDRQISIRGDATIYDQNINATRSYSGDLTATATPEDQIIYADLIDRFIQAMMTEHNITQADIDEGQTILDAAMTPTQVAPEPAPMAEPLPPIPPPEPQPLGPGSGSLAIQGESAPVPPVATEEGEGKILIPTPS